MEKNENRYKIEKRAKKVKKMKKMVFFFKKSHFGHFFQYKKKSLRRSSFRFL